MFTKRYYQLCVAKWRVKHAILSSFLFVNEEGSRIRAWHILFCPQSITLRQFSSLLSYTFIHFMLYALHLLIDPLHCLRHIWYAMNYEFRCSSVRFVYSMVDWIDVVMVIFVPLFIEHWIFELFDLVNVVLKKIGTKNISIWWSTSTCGHKEEKNKHFRLRACANERKRIIHLFRFFVENETMYVNTRSTTFLKSVFVWDEAFGMKECMLPFNHEYSKECKFSAIPVNAKIKQFAKELKFVTL